MFLAWKEFSRGKHSKLDVASFELKLEENIFDLYKLLEPEAWKPDPYQIFFVRDPKLREIHKASVRDRVLYQAVYQVLYHVFDPSFVFHSYSSRRLKGTHLGVKNFSRFLTKATKNRKVCGYVLKCDIRKFFDSIDHQILLALIKQKISDERLLKLLESIIYSFEKTPGKGLPLGNVTSQLFANIYLNELDQFVKKGLKAEYYIRYCDDFVILDTSIKQLNCYLENIDKFCRENLSLNLHPRKVEIRKLQLGTDFLGYVSLLNHTVLRTRTKRRMLAKLELLNRNILAKKVSLDKAKQVVASYLGMLDHCREEKIKEQMKNKIFEKYDILIK